MAALVDTNVLVYRFDARFPKKQAQAIELLRQGIEEDSIRVPHQAIVEFVAAVTRPIRGQSILPRTKRGTLSRSQSQPPVFVYRLNNFVIMGPWMRPRLTFLGLPLFRASALDSHLSEAFE